MPNRERFVSILVGIFLVYFSQVANAESETIPVSGQVTKVRFEPLEMSLPIWIPPSHVDDEDRLWPVLLYYHGTNGSPTLRFAKNASGGDDWIIIGMSYLQKGRFSYDPEALLKEIDLYQRLLESWNRKFSLRLDPDRVYVGGFSKGGWISGLFLEEDPRLAGAVILGAGHADRFDFDAATTSLQGKSAYFGTGESDGNFAMSFRGLEVYRSMGAEVTWEFWEGLGHALPAKVSPGLRQWFRIEGQSGSSQTIQSDAIDWLEEQWTSIESLESDSERWVAVEKLKDAPWFQYADRELIEEVRDAEIAMLQSPLRESEVEAKDQFFGILKTESKNRYVETVRKAKKEYESLASEMPDTYWGKRAATARDRCAILLP